MAGNVTALQELAESLADRITMLEIEQNATSFDLQTAMDTMWIFSCGVEICTMQLGFAMLEAGFVREQNVVATYMKNIVDFLISIFAATMGSYNLAYPDDEVYIPEVNTAPEHHAIRTAFFFHLLFQGTAATIVSGAMAERVTIKGYMAYSLFLSGLVYPLAVRLTWGGGLLGTLGTPGTTGYEWGFTENFHDFAGSGVVHLVGGSAAAVGTVLVGARTGRWDEELASKFVPHNLSLVLSGMLILWCGWYGFNTGSSLALSDLDTASVVSTAFVSTTAAAAGGGATIVLLSLFWTRGQSIDVLHMVNGILGGLVAITAGCDVISGWHAIIIGIISAIIGMIFTWGLEKCYVDDVCDAIGVHGMCGYFGLLAVGLFDADRGYFTVGETELLKTQAVGGVVLSLVSALPSTCFLIFLKCIKGLRIDAVEESMGLDAKLGFQAYVRSSDQAREFRDIVSVLEACEHTPEQAVEALASLKQAKVLTLTPQAADNKLRGELEDIIGALDTNKLDDQNWEFFSFLSHHKKDGGEVARVFVEGFKTQLVQKAEHQSVIQRFKDTNLIFLDSNNLRDLASLLPRVERTMNIVVLMTRQVLKRPWCIAEITRAFHAGRRIILVVVEWPDKKTDPRAFRMPQDLDEAVLDITKNLGSGDVTKKASSLSNTSSVSWKRTGTKNLSDKKHGSVPNSPARAPSLGTIRAGSEAEESDDTRGDLSKEASLSTTGAKTTSSPSKGHSLGTEKKEETPTAGASAAEVEQKEKMDDNMFEQKQHHPSTGDLKKSQEEEVFLKVPEPISDPPTSMQVAGSSTVPSRRNRPKMYDL
mmetsp:Transcript_55857/g.130731  ORF Transcript_55857/g.130731 Transcript_55857/m.130731 type:complete len:817 (+) Transcript_55857:69-2519(+)